MSQLPDRLKGVEDNSPYRETQQLQKIKIRDLGHPCGAATRGPRTKQPTARLDRWVILRDLLVDAWKNPTEPQEDILHRHLQALSQLERDLIRRMFLNVRRILPVPEGAEINLEGQSSNYDAPDAGVTTSIFLTWSIALPDGKTEHFRLKTGRSGTTPDEAAVIWSAAGSNETFYDVMAWPGEVEEIARPPSLEEHLRTTIENSPALRAPQLRPGRYCLWCDRSARCGAYPPADDVPVATYARTVNLSKTDLIDLGICERRVAWRRVHGIPYDDGEDPAETEELSQGIEFHRMLSAAHGTDDPATAIDNFLRTMPLSEISDLKHMWDNHMALIEAEGLTIRRTEYPVGISFVDGPKQDLRGVTLIALIDLTARDLEGMPAAIEVKTGAWRVAEIENDLYALGVRPLIPPEVPIVIHRHHVRKDPPACERVEYSHSDLVEAEARLRERLAPALRWSWDDPLQPPYQVGAWCQGCRHQGTCSLYRAERIIAPSPF